MIDPSFNAFSATSSNCASETLPVSRKVRGSLVRVYNDHAWSEWLQWLCRHVSGQAFGRKYRHPLKEAIILQLLLYGMDQTGKKSADDKNEGCDEFV